MSATDEELYSQMLRVENKDVFVDLRKNDNGIYLKLSERRGNQRKTVLIPASGIARLQAALEEATTKINQTSKGPGKGKAESKGASAVTGPVKSVYVSGLPWSTTELELAAHFSKAGKVQKATVLTQTRRGRVVSMGCAVIEFNTTREAENAMKLFNNTEIGGRAITVREDRKVGEEKLADDTLETSTPIAKASSVPAASKVLVPNKVFIRNLAWSTSDTSLVQAFGLAGRVIEAKVNQSKSGRSLGTGVVEYTDPDSATKAIQMLNGKDLDGRKIAVREFYED